MDSPENSLCKCIHREGTGLRAKRSMLRSWFHQVLIVCDKWPILVLEALFSLRGIQEGIF